MAWVLFVSPGIRAADAAAAKIRYEGEDEKDDCLDQARIRSVAGELMREHSLQVASEDDEESGAPSGLDLEGAGDAPAPEVRVDCWGVTVSIGGPEDLQLGLAAARTASRLLGGAVYDTDRDRILDPSEGIPDVSRAAAEVFTRSGSGPASPSMKRARTAAIVFMLIPTVGFLVARRFFGGGPAFAAVFLAMAAMAVFTSWWSRRPTPAAPGETPRPAAPPQDRGVRFQDRPMSP